MKSYTVQAIYGNNFEDISVKARSDAEAIEKAKAVTTLRSRWTRFVV